MEAEVRNVIIIGSGPAGYTAALYTARANLKPLLFAGDLPGGQLMTTTEVENYPGFPEGIQGPELMERFREQAERFGTEIRWEPVTGVNLRVHPFVVESPSGQWRAKALILATGASPRKLGVPGERELSGRGVSYCATCDGFFFRGKVVGVVGGGDSAAEEALYLTHHASKVYLIHRRDRLRASKIMQERVLSHEKIEVIWNTVVLALHGTPETGLQSVRLRHVLTEEERDFPLDGLFVAIGHEPNTALFRGQVEMDERGYIITDRETRTNIPGVFAAGDVQDHVFRQAVTAAGSGCAAAIMAERFLAALEGQAYPGWEMDPRQLLAARG